MIQTWSLCAWTYDPRRCRIDEERRSPDHGAHVHHHHSLIVMKLSDRLARMIDGMPDDASITITIEAIRGMLDEAESESDPPDRPVVASLEDHLLTVDEAAGVLAVERTWLYRHADKLPFTRKLSAGTLRFSSKGLHRWLASRK